MRLSKKFIDALVKQFRRDKCAFIYGKNLNEAHFITDIKKGTYSTMERISKLNPKYLNMVVEMMKELEKPDENLLLL